MPVLRTGLLGACSVIALGSPFAFTAPTARAVEPPGVRWEVSPGPDADGVPAASGEAATGPIGGASSNAQATLSAEGSVTVDLGSALLHAASGYQPGGAPVYATWCTPASGACIALRAEWSDTLVLHSPDAADGTTGSFTAALAVHGALAANLPAGWSSYAGTLVRSTWGASVFVDGVVRDTLVVTCHGSLAGSCVPSGARNYYPPGGGYEVIPLPAGFGSFELGPYDFTWGLPFRIEVWISATTAVDREGNLTGAPSASTDVASATFGVSSLHGASAGGGDPLPVGTARAGAASGSDWFGVPLPEPALGGQAAAGALALAALGRCRRARRARAAARAVGRGRSRDSRQGGGGSAPSSARTRSRSVSEKRRARRSSRASACAAASAPCAASSARRASRSAR